MVSAVTPDVRTFPDADTLSRAAALSLVERVKAIAGDGSRFSLALAGGGTPRALYRLLASEFRGQIPWAQVHLFWGDERYVPPSDSRSNYLMARESLLSHVPIPSENVHPMPTDLPRPEDAASAYERTLRGYFPAPWPRFDLVLLGLGADGHTASLFPGSPVLEENERWVVAVTGPAEPRLRLSLTLPVLTHSTQIHFLVTGADKAPALERAVADAPNPRSCPAAGVRPSHGAVIWWTDAAAAALLQKSLRLRSTIASTTDTPKKQA